MTRPRDPNCTCGMAHPDGRRIWCDHCCTEGPLPGSLADPRTDERIAACDIDERIAAYDTEEQP